MSAALHDFLNQFSNFRFPRLSTFHLGLCETSNPAGDARSLTTFLVAHPSIEDLGLDFSWPRLKKYCRLSPNAVLGPGVLPNLRHLKTEPYNLALLIRSGVLSLKLLETLYIGTGDGVTERAIAKMYGALEAFGGLPALTSLKLENYDPYDELEYTHLISRLGRLCPMVERLWSDQYVRWAMIGYQAIFASYSNLKLQLLCDIQLGRLSKQERMEKILEFVAPSSSVRELRIYDSFDEELIMYWFVIERDAEGVITSMVDRLEGQEICRPATIREISCCPTWW